MLTNAGSFHGHNASLILSKNFDGGIFTEGGSSFFSFGYAYSAAQDRRNMYNSTAGSNYDVTAAFDRQNPAPSRGFYSSKHNVTVSTSFAETFFGDDLETRLGLTFVARAGRPYSLTFTGSGQFNDSASGSDNALAYIPTGPNDPNVVFLPTLSSTGAVTRTAAQVAEDIEALVSRLPCADEARGTSIKRNTCSNDWYYDLDLTFSQEIPGPGRFFGVDDKIKLFATVDNFLNLLDSSWNVQHRRDFGGRQDVATAGRAAVTQGATTPAVAPVDAQGRYVISAFNPDFDRDNTVNVSSSVWRLKVGVSYEF